MNRMVAAMRVGVAGAAFLLDIGDLAGRRQFTITTDDAPAGERPKPEEPHQTHGPSSVLVHRGTKREGGRSCAKQTMYLAADESGV